MLINDLNYYRKSANYRSKTSGLDHPSHSLYTTEDRHHMNQETNKVYADYFYNQWKQRNES